MGRLLEIWRAWSVPRRAAVGAGAALVVVGAVAVAYLVLKRPGDVVNTGVTFEAREVQEKKAKEKTVNWPLYGLNRARTRYVPAKGLKPPYRMLWHFDAEELLEFSPIVVRSTVYVMSNDAKVFAINSETGNVKWKQRIGKLSASAPAFAHKRLYLTTLEPGQAVALNAKSGKVVWRRELPGRSESSPVVAGGRVFFGDESGNVWALDEDKGKVAWQTPTAGNVKAGPALHDGTLYVGDYAGEMYAIRAQDGAVRWQASDLGAGFGRSGRFYSTPAVAFGRVYAGNADGRVYSFEEGTGDLAWSRSLDGYVYAAPAVADAPGTPPGVFIGTNGGTAYGLNARSGAEMWSTAVGGEISGAGSVIGEIFYLSDVDLDKTVGFDIASGKPVYNIDRGEYNPMVSDGKRLYLTGYASITGLEPRRRRKESGGSKGANEPPKKDKRKPRKRKPG
ncbi:MAG: PQQ-binding-like beta-propeller repeat protein [Solirubrobacterales bacterium]